MRAPATLIWLLSHAVALCGNTIPTSAAGIQEASLEFSRKAWTTSEGLPDNQIRDIVQTRDGYLWLGTRKGLARFDGLKFTLFNQGNTPAMTTELCWLLAEDSERRLWVGTPNGLMCYFEGTFTRYTTNDGLSNNFVDALCPAGTGGIWVGTFQGLNRFDGEHWQSFYITKPNPNIDQRLSRHKDRITALHEDRHGRLWVGTPCGLYRFEAVTGRFVSDFPALEDNSGFIRAIYLDSEESLWIAHWWNEGSSALLSVLRDGKWVEHSHGWAAADGKTLLASNDQSARFWFPSTRWRIENMIDPVSRGLRLPLAGGVETIYSAMEDREGDLWLGTRENGLHCWRPGANAIRTFRHGMPNPISWAVCEDADGRVWIGTEFGIALITGDDLKLLTAEDGLTDNRVRSLAVDSQGRVLIGTLSGLDVFEKGRLRPITTPGGEAEHRVRAILCGDGGLLWLGTDGGALRFQDGNWAAFTTANGLADDRVTGILATRDGAVWIGTPRGLCRFFDGQLVTFGVRNGLLSPFACPLLEDSEGRLWIATESGLNLYQEGRFLAVTRGQGLVDDRVNGMLQDGTGHVWISTGMGIFRVEEKQLRAVAERKTPEVSLTTFGEGDGILSPDTSWHESQPPAYRTRDGRLWFATRAGVAVIDPAKLHALEISPPVVIERIRSHDGILFSNEPLKPEAEGHPSCLPASLRGQIGLHHEIELPPGGGRLLEFQFTAISLKGPERVRFKCRLDGLDPDWVDLGSRRTVSYADLGPGPYRFRVIASNAHGVWNETGASFAFFVRPSIHQTWWFRALAFVFAGAMIAVAFHRRTRAARRFRTERQDAVASERSRIAKDLHDSLGVKLTEMDMLIAQATRASDASSGEHLRKLSTSTREAVRTLKEIIWISDPGDETLEGLISAICQKAEEFLAPAEIRCRFDLPEEFPAIPLSLEQRRNLLLAAKEALNNVAKHASASEVRVRASVAGSDFLLSIEDNGRGFNLECGLSDGHGLTIMKERVEALDGRLDLESSPAAGTKIRVQIPLRRLEGARR